MSVINSIPLIAAGDDGYQISRSVRLRSSASAYFNRTPASTGNRRTFTWSGWVKRSSTSSTNILFTAASDTSNSNLYELRYISDGGASGIVESLQIAGPVNYFKGSAQYRDPSAWYHIVWAVDTTQAVQADRCKIYVNGTTMAVASNNLFSLNEDTSFNTASYPMRIGNRISSNTLNFDGYLTEVNFIDGQALTPSSFGETDSLTGVWKPKKYAGTYGTNGFYLNFADNSAATAAAIGKDYSGNGNNWTPNNISVTAGVTYDSMIDVPTLWADGGNGRGNYAVLNPLDINGGSVSDGNLKYAGAGRVRASMAFPSSGLWYVESSSSGTNASIDYILGLIGTSATLTSVIHANPGLNFYISDTRYFQLNNAALFTKAGAVASTDVMQIAIDTSSGKVWLGINNTWYDSAGNATGNPSAGTGQFATLSTSTSWSIYTGVISGAQNSFVNFGQRPFAYTPPTGFVALNTQNLPDATIKKGNQYFDATTYTGTGASQNIVNSGAFQPDLVWAKRRNSAADHALVDSVRGVVKTLFSSSTAAEDTTSQTVTAFNSNGFTVGNTGYTGSASDTYVGWQWKESVSAGFDIVTYMGTGSATTVAHNLGVAPSMMIVRNRSDGTVNWRVYHKSIGATNFLSLNLTNASAAASSVWNNTSPTSSVFSVANDGGSNGSGNSMVAYLFAEVAGFSKFGSYTGNGSADGPFVYCGFRPRFVLVKGSSNASSWQLFDTSRPGYNANDNTLWADLSSAEGTGTARIDLLSNGFKVRAPAGTDPNVSGATYIYAAFAENPFKNSLAR